MQLIGLQSWIMEVPQAIRPLSPESQAQIRSSVVITSLNDVIIGLLENALDAGATSVNIRLDYVKGYCSIIDNGAGISAAEFAAEGRLGSLHCTSKLDPSHRTYGRYGRFLFPLAALSLLNITSRQTTHESSLTLHRTKVIARSSNDVAENPTILHRHGCQVVVGNLFGDIPVRYRHIATRLENVSVVDAEFTALKGGIVALLLAGGHQIEIKAVETRTKQAYRHKVIDLDEQRTRHLTGQNRCSFELDNICSILRQAGYVDHSETASWKLASVRTSSIRIRAAISLVPAPSKEVQFVSLGHRSLSPSTSASMFLDEINTIFENSCFGASEDNVDLSEAEQERRGKDRRFASDRHTGRQLNGQKKGVDRWPMFYIRIDLQDAQTNTLLEDSKHQASSTEKWIEKILALLRSMFHEFLSVHHFRPRARRKRKLERVSLNRYPTAGAAVDLPGKADSPVRFLPSRAASEPGLVPKHFDVWSRVKTGARAAVPKTAQIADTVNPDFQHAYSGRPQTPAERVQLAQNALGQAELQALDEKGLEALLEDFSGEQSDAGSQISGTIEHFNEKSAVDPSTADFADEPTYLWTNPATGMEYKINARNGLIIPQAELANIRQCVSANIEDPERPMSAPAETTIAQRIRPKPAKKTPAELIAFLQQSDLIRSFRPFEQPIPSIVPHDLDETGDAPTEHSCNHRPRKTSEYFSVSSNMMSHNLTKDDLECAEVLAQVDHKFILVQTQPTDDSDPVLVLIDQHAADERVKVEELYTQLCSGEATNLSKPVIFEVSQRESELFARHQRHLADWHLMYDLKEVSRHVIIRALPSLVAERCRLDPKLLIDMLRREIHAPLSTSFSSSTDWIHRIPHCPAGLVEMINSRACRSAIMFNDVLDKSQCGELVKKLVRCVLPFQCAHGRPSCVVLPRWGDTETEQRHKESTFAERFTTWKR
jgi:DNA mismatch repair protein MLH3